MGYRIDPGEPTDLELRRALREQLDQAAETLRVPGGPDAEAVHGARKRLKKARSLLRLARADLGAAVARHANAELRQVGADLATQRDADALVEAVDRLRADAAADDATAAALGVVRDRLAERAERVRAAGAIDRATLLGAARVLDQLGAWIDLVPANAEGWAAIGPGLARQHRRAREALAALPDEPSADQLHEWRKRVKDVWYHQRLLRRLWPEAQRPLIDAADELAAALGDDHDLAILVALLTPPDGPDTPDAPDARDGAPAEAARPTAPAEAVALDEADRALVVAVAETERARLQARARHLGARLLADRAGPWADRHGAWWAAAVDEATQTRAAERTDGPDPSGGETKA